MGRKQICKHCVIKMYVHTTQHRCRLNFLPHKIVQRLHKNEQTLLTQNDIKTCIEFAFKMEPK